MVLPDILKSVSGEEVGKIEDWERFRRPEILGLFKNHVYGVRPIERPEDLAFTKVREVANFMENMSMKQIRMSFSGYEIPFYIFSPQNGQAPLPVFVYLMHDYQYKLFDIDTNPELPMLPISNIVKRGYAVALLPLIYLDPDQYDEGFKNGVHGVFDKGRDESSWGAISAWAWGGSRVMDYLEGDGDFDPKRVAIIGHSRGGKTALWCGACDERFAMAVSNSSGCTGAAVTRGKGGEQIEDICTGFRHWFCAQYKGFAGREEMLPIDQHMLAALIAPRLLYIQSSSGDDWADPEKELLSARLASSVYELYGKKGLVADDEIKLDTPYHEGSIAYHRRNGKHSITPFDWEMFMDFADKNL